MNRILITGASRGIGRAIAEKLADSDVTLLLHGRDTVALAETCKAVQSRCAGVVKLIHDLATEKGVANLISEVGGDPLNVLINNAGIAVVKPFRSHARRMETNARSQCDRAVFVDAAVRRANAARFERCKYSFDRRANGFRELEHL